MKKREPTPSPLEEDVQQSKETNKKMHLAIDENVKIFSPSELFNQEKVVKKKATRKNKDDSNDLLREFTDPFAEEKSSVISSSLLLLISRNPSTILSSN